MMARYTRWRHHQGHSDGVLRLEADYRYPATLLLTSLFTGACLLRSTILVILREVIPMRG